MVYGNATVAATPWELTAKLYRAHLGDQRFATLSEYSDNLVAFLGQPPILEANRDQNELVQIAYDIAEKLRKRCSGLPKNAASKAFEKEIAALNKMLDEKEDLSSYEIPTEAQFSRKHARVCKEVLEEVFEKDEINQACRSEFPALVRKFTGKEVFTDYRSGFSVFGYGESEIFPSINVRTIDGAPYGKFRIGEPESHSINRDAHNAAGIFALARSDAASTFLEDISPNMRRFFSKAMKFALDGFSERLFKELESSGKITASEKIVYAKLFEDQVSSFNEKFQEEVGKYIYAKSQEPILNALEGLSKEDMAKLAESLVELSSLKLHVSNETEVVGGPIDVAVLSKGDGFIWVKRKHYFDTKFNPHFLKGYN